MTTTGLKPAPFRQAAAVEVPRRARSAEAKNGVRATLIRAGRDLMAAAGEEPISLRGIARHAGYSSGVIYRYFPDREALFAAIRDSEINAFVDELELRLSAETNAEDRIRLIADESYRFSCQQIDTFGMKSLFLAKPDYLAKNQPLVHQRDEAPSAARVHRLYASQIEDFIAPAVLTEAELSFAVASLMAAISGTVMLPAGSTHSDFPDGRVIMRKLLDMLFSDWRIRPKP